MSSVEQEPSRGGPETGPRPPTVMRVAFVVAVNDVRRRSRDRTALLTGIVTPLVMAAVIGMAFGGGMNVSASIAVVDADGSATSSAIVEGLIANVPDDQPVRVVRSKGLSATRAALARGDVDAVIIVPPGFGASVATMGAGGEPRSLRVVTDAGRQISGDIARSIAEGISARLGASVLAVGTAMDAAGPTADPAVLRDVATDAADVAVPIVLESSDVGGRYAPVAYFGASMGVLFLFFTVGGGARSLMTERADGTLQRMRAAPVADAAVLLGKSAGVLVLGLMSLLTIWAVTSVVFRASWGDPLAVLLVIVAVVLAVAGVSTVIAGWARTDAQADGMTAVVAFVFALLGGTFTQPGSLPPLLAKVALVTPNGWALRAVTLIGAGGAGVADVLPHVAVLLAIAVVTATIGVRSLRLKALA